MNDEPEVDSILGPDVEVAVTTHYGWGWHCYRCLITRLDYADCAAAYVDARGHRESLPHARMPAEYSRRRA